MAHVARRSGRRSPWAEVLGTAAAVLLVVALFALEVWRSSAFRNDEGEGSPALAPFFAELLGGW